jgi:hypothetical protein
MAETRRIPDERLSMYFDEFTKRFLRDQPPRSVDVQVLEPEWGDQYTTEGARLIGLTYDEKRNSLEFELASGDHRVYEPREVWAVEESDGFLSSIEVVCDDDVREVVSLKKVGLRRRE